MRWFIFIVEPQGIRLETEVAPRPADARPDNGDPFTPWYEEGEHYDSRHIHLKAETLDAATTRAEEVYKWLPA